MTASWVDFQKVKEEIPIDKVFGRYGVKLRPAGEGEMSGLCPFHDDKKPSLRVSTAKGLFFFHGCGAKGNILDVVTEKEGVEVREAALMLVDWFGITDALSEAPEASGQAQEQEKRQSSSTGGGERGSGDPGLEPGDEPGNKPLTFELKVDPEHPYIQGRGLSPETIQHFGLGYCSRGVMKNRVVIPIPDEKGQLVPK